MSITTRIMTDTVSIIIPACNAASRIRMTLESVTAQDYGDVEIIVVDDASSDDTGMIAREILGSSGRNCTVLAHGVNMGVSSARNTGFDVSRGKYVCFVDADDLLRADFVSGLYAEISRGKYDIAFCGLTDRFTDGRSDKEMFFSRGISRGIAGANVIMNDTVPPFMCCMYSADFLRKYELRFHEGCTSGEDTEFQMKAFCMAGSVTFTQEAPYIYMHHNEMGSVRDNDTREKRILRYGHNTQAQTRTAEYLAKHSASESVRELAVKILMPQSVIRRLNLSAMKHDRAGYNSLLNDNKAMNILRRALCFYTLRRKPEVFMKALTVMVMPGIYYRVRAR